MTEIGPRDVAPPWLWLATAASALLAVASVFLSGASTATGVLAVLAVVGVTALLYRWGQHRDRNAERDDDSDTTSRREREVEVNNDGWS